MGALSSRARVPGTLAGMKTDALISLCGRLLLALMLAAPAGVALSPSPAMAQAAPAAASDKDKAAQGGNANAAAANPAPAPASPIPPANVVSRAESEENALNIIRNRLQASPQRDGIKQRLARLARDTAEARTLSHLAMDSDSQRRMRDIEPTWAQLQAEVTAVDKQLTQVAEALQEDFNRLNAMQKAWEGAQAAEEIKASPQVIRTRVQEVLNQIQDTRKAASKIRSGIFDLQAQSSKLQATISSEQALLKNTLTASIDSLFKTDSPALFGASNAESTDGSTLTGLARLRSDGHAIVEYLRIHPVRSIALLAWLVLVFATLHLLRPRVEAKISEQPVLRSVRWLLQDPLSVAVLTTVTMAAVVLPYPPASLNLLLGLVALAPTVQLLRQVVERSLATYLYWLLAMFAFNQVPEILKFDPTWERLFFQSQLLLTILVLMHLTRDRRRAFVQARAEAEAENETVSSEALPPDSSTKHVDQNARSLRLTGYAINTVLAGCSAALVTDLLGFTRLARFISASTLNSLFAGVILLAGSLVLLSLLRLAGNLRPLNRLKMLDEDGALIEARLRRVVYWVAVLLWTGYTLNQVMLLSPLTDALGNFLSTPLKIGQISVSLADLLRAGLADAAGLAPVALRAGPRGLHTGVAGAGHSVCAQQHPQLCGADRRSADGHCLHRCEPRSIHHLRQRTRCRGRFRLAEHRQQLRLGPHRAVRASHQGGRFGGHGGAERQGQAHRHPCQRAAHRSGGGRDRAQLAAHRQPGGELDAVRSPAPHRDRPGGGLRQRSQAGHQAADRGGARTR